MNPEDKNTGMLPHFFVDIHCHPSVKPYARSFRDNPGHQKHDASDSSSMWYSDKPTLFDKLKNYVASLTNFIQADAASLLKGRVAIVCLSFYPQEKAFFVNKAGTGLPSDLMTMLVTEFGKERIDYIQEYTSYWEDLKKEMNFLCQQENMPIEVNGKSVRYSIARSYDDIELAARSGELGETLVVFVPTIEGGHIFDQIINSTLKWDEVQNEVREEKLNTVLQRVKELRAGKDGMIRPVFMTLAHHFWNGLCGHERSLGSIVRCAIDQENGLKQGFTSAGKEVVRALLRDETDESQIIIPPVYIDIKHMSRLSREQYFLMLDTEFADRNIPVIASHAGVTGLSKPGGSAVTAAAQEGLFMQDPINIYDDELLRIESSGGLFGIQLDERRIGSKQALRSARGNISRREILYHWSKLVWNQIRHVAEVLDYAGRYSWNIQCLGTDFDGIIDPINGYWTAESIDDLDDYLLKHAYNYLKEIKEPCSLTQERNRIISPEEVVDRVMTSNALAFLSTYY
ncbi:hypothetical protein [Rubrolithibacter danxiaensis]|uniref:hypothetical protein n=1 Tax=Rubrolithibacter danxiaensis TaxID=3390805 RepID=UPI003BF8083E